MRTITLRPDHWEGPAIVAGDTTLIDFGAKPRTGTLDITGQGGALRIDDGRNAGNKRIIAKGPMSGVEMIGMRVDTTGGPPDDCIDLACQTPFAAIRRSRLSVASGNQGTKHPDGVQVQDGAAIDVLLIQDTTILTPYQGVMSWRRPDGTGVRKLILERVNIRDIPALRQQMSIAFYMGDQLPGDKNAPYEIVFIDCYADWPDEHHMTFFPKGAIVTGAPKRGLPPNGDYCPA